jgi:glycosyltransferase involved in cell wall biosynthesis
MDGKIFSNQLRRSEMKEMHSRRKAMRILIIAMSNLENDPRVFRQISGLSKNHDVTCMGYHHPGIEQVKFIQIESARRTIFEKFFLVALVFSHCYDAYLQGKLKNLYQLKQKVLPENFDVIIANDIDTLPFALEIKNNAKILFDAHEYSPREFEDLWLWKLLYQKYRFYQCRKYIPQCDKMITVCDGIADEYQKNFEITPDVITNATKFEDLMPLTVNPEKIRIIHHGGVNPSRKIEKMIEMMDFVDTRFTLDLMLVQPEGSSTYFSELKKMVENRTNVRFVDPVPMGEIVRRINHYDIGFYILEPNSFNHLHALPNKLFEFIQARLAIAIGPSPEMSKIVTEYDLGIISDDFAPESMAKRLNNLTADQIIYYKIQSHKAANALSSEANMEKLERMIRDQFS